MAGPMTSENTKKNPLREIVQPFIDLVHAPRALWGVNLAWLLEGMAYFGILQYLAIHFSGFIFKGADHPDIQAHKMVGVLTAGITISMFFLGFVGDKWGVRKALLLAFSLLLTGRILIAGAPTIFGLQPAGLYSSLHLTTMLGIVFAIIGYGMYQPSAYAAVRQFTTPKTAGMAFAMLYALMNLGGCFNLSAFLLRDEKYLGLGIPGTYWVYTGMTVVALLWTYFILSRRTVETAIATAKAETKAQEAVAENKNISPTASATPIVEETNPVIRWLKNHPLANPKFAFFVFCLMPVQTLFTYNWFILPAYVQRAYTGWIGEKFEIASNLNGLLLAIILPVIAAATQKYKVYNLMIVGTFLMAAPAFLLAIGTTPFLLFTFIVILTIGEALWQPRFLQYVAQIAPEGRTGQFMGVAQLPWFLTKVLVPLLYSGKIMDKYCPEVGTRDPETMWLIFGCIAICSTLLLLLGKNWVGKDMHH